MLTPSYGSRASTPVSDPGLSGLRGLGGMGGIEIREASPLEKISARFRDAVESQVRGDFEGRGGLDFSERTPFEQITDKFRETAEPVVKGLSEKIKRLDDATRRADKIFTDRMLSKSRRIRSGCVITDEIIPPPESGLLPYSYSWIDPNCRTKEQPKPDPPPKPDPGDSPTSGFPSNIAGDTIVYAFVSFNGTREYFKKWDYDLFPTTYTTTYFATWSDFKCPGVPFSVGSGGGLLISPQVTGSCTYGASNTGTESTGEPINSRGEDKVFQFFASSFSRSISLQNGRLIRGGCFSLGPTPNGLGGFDILYGRYDDIKQYCTEISQGYSLSYNHSDPQLTISESRSATITLDYLFDATCTPLKKPTSPPSNRRPPPPPQSPPRRCCMGCCPSNVNNSNNDALLRQIFALLQKVDRKFGETPFTVDIYDSDENKKEAQKKTESVNSFVEGLKIIVREGQKELKILGVDTFPLNTKKTTIFPEKSGIWEKIFASINPDEDVKITSILDFLIWQEEQRQAQMGRWMQVIEVEDTDVLKEGDQYKKVVLPNVAESLKEVVMQNVLNARTQGLVLDISLKILSEVCSSKILSAQATTIVKDIQEYLDYTSVEKAFEVPVQISIPGKDLSQEEESDLAKFLQPSTQPFVSAEWDGKMSFSDALLNVLQAVSIIRAAGYKQT